VQQQYQQPQQQQQQAAAAAVAAAAAESPFVKPSRSSRHWTLEEDTIIRNHVAAYGENTCIIYTHCTQLLLIAPVCTVLTHVSCVETAVAASGCSVYV
jgi:hypothetical protein